MRGGKYSEFEGGVRVASFVSGGFIQESARGKQGTGLGTLSDVWGTLCALVAVDPIDHTAAAVVDGVRQHTHTHTHTSFAMPFYTQKDHFTMTGA